MFECECVRVCFHPATELHCGSRLAPRDACCEPEFPGRQIVACACMYDEVSVDFVTRDDLRLNEHCHVGVCV